MLGKACANHYACSPWVGGRHKDADVVPRASIRRVGPCEMVEIDGGARAAAGGSPLHSIGMQTPSCSFSSRASAMPLTLAAHLGAAFMPAFRVPSSLD